MTKLDYFRVLTIICVEFQNYRILIRETEMHKCSFGNYIRTVDLLLFLMPRFETYEPSNFSSKKL